MTDELLPIASVIIVTYNHRDFLDQSLDSVLSQKTQYNFEIIIADDCSTDGTLELIKKKKEWQNNIIILSHETNVGTTRNICDAFEIAKGKYITILAGDDYWCDEYLLEKQVKWLEINPDYLGVSNSYSILRNGELKRNCVKKSLLNKDHSTELYLNGNGFLTHSTTFRNIFKGAERFGYYRHIQSDRLIEDISLSMILLDKGKFRILPGDVAVYRVRKDGNNYNSIKNIMDEYKEHIDNIMANDSYFDGRYDFSKMVSMRVTIAILKVVISRNFSLIPPILKIVPEKYRETCFLRFPADTLSLIKYKIKTRF